MRPVLTFPATLRQHVRNTTLALARAVLRRPGLTRRLRALLVHLPSVQARLYHLVQQAPPPPAAARPPSDPDLSPRAQHAFVQLQQALAWHAATERRARAQETAAAQVAAAKPRLAFVSPLPPERSGIADYAAQLLPALMTYFDIELVLQQDKVTLAPELAALPRRSVAWFTEHGDEFDHILYQFGNNPFHSHMFALLQRHPGVVVLHDFFLSSLQAYRQLSGIMPGAWTDALFAAHGYPALRQSLLAQDGNEALKLRYPCNLAVLQSARRVVVHASAARELAQQWYGAEAVANWDVVPLPRSAPAGPDRASARAALGIAPSTYLVCSFGFVTPSKLCHELVRAWLASSLHTDAHCQLVLVGANHGGDYGLRLSAMLADAGGRVRIAGWTDEALYRQYLRAADAAVQLRTASRGESSAAVLDCMNYGLPTIVNAHGSMAALPDDGVLKLPDRFDIAALRDALERLRADPAGGRALGARAAQLLSTEHRPAHCAALYARALQQAAADAASGRMARVRALATQPGLAEDVALQRQLACTLALEPEPLTPRQLLVDVSGLASATMQSASALAARTQLLAMLEMEPAGLRVEAIYLCQEQGKWRYRYARRYCYALLGMDPGQTWDPLADIGDGDIYFGLGCASADIHAAAAAGLFSRWRTHGVQVNFALRDVPPAATPDTPAAGVDDAAWLDTVATQADRLVCASAAQLSEVLNWLSRPERARVESAGQAPLRLAAPDPDTGLDMQQLLLILTGGGQERLGPQR